MSPEASGTIQPGLAVRTFRALSWSLSSSGIEAILRIAILAALARLVAPEEFGVVTAAWIVMDLIKRFSQLGVGQALVQRSELTTRHVRTGFTLCLLTGLVFAGILFAGSPSLAAFFRMPELGPVLRVTSSFVILNSLGAVAAALLKRDLAFHRLAIIDIVAMLGYGAVGVGMGLAGHGIWALVGASLAHRVLLAVQLMVAKRHSVVPLLDLQAARDLLRFGGGVTLAGFLNFAAQDGDNFIVGRWLGEVALGFYGRAYNILRMPLTLFGDIINEVMFSAMSQVQDNPRAMGVAYRRGSFAIAMLVLPLGAFLFVLSEEIVDVVLGGEWGRTAAILKVFAVGMLFRTAYSFGGTVIRSSGAVYRLALRQALYGAMVLGGAWFGKEWGLEGVAVGVTVAIIVQYLMMAQLSLSIVNLSWSELIKAHGAPLLVAGIVTAEVAGLAHVLRQFSAPSIATVGASCALVGATMTALMITALPRILGQDGLWIARLFVKTYSRKLPGGDWLERKVLEHVGH